MSAARAAAPCAHSSQSERDSPLAFRCSNAGSAMARVELSGFSPNRRSLQPVGARVALGLLKRRVLHDGLEELRAAQLSTRQQGLAQGAPTAHIRVIEVCDLTRVHFSQSGRESPLACSNAGCSMMALKSCVPRSALVSGRCPLGALVE